MFEEACVEGNLVTSQHSWFVSFRDCSQQLWLSRRSSCLYIQT